MKKSLAILILTGAVIITGCSKGNEAKKDGKYEIKAGSFTYELVIPGMGPVETVTWFDNYGARSVAENSSELKMFGQSIKQHTRTITKDGYVYSLDMLKKTGTKMKMEGAGEDLSRDFVALAAVMKDSLVVKELGTEEFLGKKCRKVQISMKDSKSTGVYWIWKNITLKMESVDKETGQKITFAAKKIEELSSVPAEKFTVPAEFAVTETKMPAAE